MKSPKNCIYRFINMEGEVIYVGKAGHLKSRISGHGHLPPQCYAQVDKVEYVQFNTIDDMDYAERYLIPKLKPKFNTTWRERDITLNIDTFDNIKWDTYNLDKGNWGEFRKRAREIEEELQKQEELKSMRRGRRAEFVCMC